MPQIGDITLREEEVERVEWRDGRLTLRLTWRFEELPVLLDLPEQVHLSWHAKDDPEAGISVRLGSWRFASNLLLSDAVRAAPVEPPLAYGTER